MFKEDAPVMAVKPLKEVSLMPVPIKKNVDEKLLQQLKMAKNETLKGGSTSLGV